MTDTTNIQLPLMKAAQSQKHVTHNEALLILDAVVQLSVKDRDLTAPPGSPSDGDRYLIASGATGAWSGKDLNVTYYSSGVWTFLTPKEGWVCWVEDEDLLFVWNGTNWIDLASACGFVSGGDLTDGSITELGVNTSPDATNRLAVKSNAILFSHDDVTPGTGDMRITLNKSASGKDAGFFFQDGFSTRATFGLLASDDFVLKTSPDGSTFKTVFTADKTTGGFDLAQHAKFQAYVNFDAYIPLATWTKVPFNSADHNDQSAFSSSNNNFTAPQAGYYVFGCKCLYKKNTSASDPIHLKFYKNGAAVDRTLVKDFSGWGDDVRVLHATCMLKLSAGDTVDARVYFELFDGYVEANSNEFWGCRVP